VTKNAHRENTISNIELHHAHPALLETFPPLQEEESVQVVPLENLKMNLAKPPAKSVNPVNIA
jgi:hypothetical protein